MSIPVKHEKFYDIESALRFVTASSSVSMNGCKILKNIRYGTKTMNTTQAPKAQTPSRSKSTVGRLFFLEVSTGRVLSANPDGLDRKVIVTGCRIPDGVVVDVEAGHIYWTNMGPARTMAPLSEPGRPESQDDCSGGWHVHAEAATSREERRQAVLMRSRRDASYALESRWFAN